MYLSRFQSDVLARVMTTLAEPHEEREIRIRVGELMLDLLGAQHYASYVWDDTQQCFDRGVQLNMDPANLAQYQRHYQYHDPITLKMQQHRRAVRVTDVLPQSQLRRTEFFNDFLARDGLYWGVNLYAWQADRNIGDMRIWRDRKRENFSRDDLEMLDLVRPALVAALHRSRDVVDLPQCAGLVAGGVPNGAAVLSPREREVAVLAACGLPDKEIARRLGIAAATVRTHIDHAFRKLGVDNRVSMVRKLGL